MSKFIEYMQKEAAASRIIEELAEGAVGLVPYLIAIPTAGGAAAGYLASKMTSPSDVDKDALQERVLDTKVREELGIQQRRLEALKKRIKDNREKPNVSRKRDMFV